MESIEQTFSGSVAFGKKVTSTISRNGDLITQVWLECTMKKSGASYYPAEALIKDCEIEIGGSKVDKHYAAWYRIYDELHRHGDEKSAYRRMVDFVDGEADDTVKRFYVPLVFWFNRNIGLNTCARAEKCPAFRSVHSGRETGMWCARPLAACH
jgi:hypothetical protein